MTPNKSHETKAVFRKLLVKCQPICTKIYRERLGAHHGKSVLARLADSLSRLVVDIKVCPQLVAPLGGPGPRLGEPHPLQLFVGGVQELVLDVFVFVFAVLLVARGRSRVQTGLAEVG